MSINNFQIMSSMYLRCQKKKWPLPEFVKKLQNFSLQPDFLDQNEFVGIWHDILALIINTIFLGSASGAVWQRMAV